MISDKISSEVHELYAYYYILVVANTLLCISPPQPHLMHVIELPSPAQ